jgi:signal transduction histidine kinase
VLVNLALNAIQAMRATDGGRLALSLSRERGGVCLRVADTGPGISPAVRRRLFDPFFTTRPDGAGLGLFSCRRIVEAHGGRITLRSALGRGTCVRVWLPEMIPI